MVPRDVPNRTPGGALVLTAEQIAALVDLAQESADLTSMLGRATARGFTDVDVLRVVAVLDDEWLYRWDGWSDELVRWFSGDVAAAQDALSASGSELDLLRVLGDRAQAATRRRLLSAHASIPEVLGVGDDRDVLRSAAVREILLRYPSRDLVEHGVILGEDAVRDALLRRLVDRPGGPMVLGDEDFLVCWFGAAVPSEPEGRVKGRVDAQKLLGRGLWEVVPFAERHLPVRDWLPVLVRFGFSANSAALAALERGLPVAEVATLLLSAGVDRSEVLGCLEACGAGPRRVLHALADADWSPAAWVELARSSGQLEPVIRESLREIRVPEADIEALLSTSLAARAAD